MSIFDTDETAWSALTKSIEQIAGAPGSPLIVQAPTVFQPLTLKGVEPHLAMYRKQLLGDNMPTYHNKNQTGYVTGSKSVAKGFRQYLEAVNNAMITRVAAPIDLDEIRNLGKLYSISEAALKELEVESKLDWKKKKKQDPSLSIQDWDDQYKDPKYGAQGYTAIHRLLQDDVNATYGAYKNKQAAYPALDRLREALFNLDNNPRERISLPQSEDDVNYPDAWESMLKTSFDINMKWEDFFNIDAPVPIGINQTSNTSSHYESAWEARAAVSVGFFFRIGAVGGGGRIENLLRKGTQSVSFRFKKLVPAVITRGLWYDEALVTAYASYVDKNEFWAPNGVFNLVPVSALIGRGLEVSIKTSSEAHDAFQEWFHAGGGIGFSFGPWSVGAGGSTSTSSEKISNTSSDTTISFTDNSDQPYIVAVTSLKMDEYVTSRILNVKSAQADLAAMMEKSLVFEAAHPLLWDLTAI